MPFFLFFVFVFCFVFFFFSSNCFNAFFFPLDHPIRRILYSGLIGATALAICFPRQAVDSNAHQLRQTKAVCEKADNQF